MIEFSLLHTNLNEKLQYTCPKLAARPSPRNVVYERSHSVLYIFIIFLLYMITNLIDLIITYRSKDHSKNLHFCAILYYSINTQNKVNNKKNLYYIISFVYIHTHATCVLCAITIYNDIFFFIRMIFSSTLHKHYRRSWYAKYSQPHTYSIDIASYIIIFFFIKILRTT